MSGKRHLKTYFVTCNGRLPDGSLQSIVSYNYTDRREAVNHFNRLVKIYLDNREVLIMLSVADVVETRPGHAQASTALATKEMYSDSVIFRREFYQ